MLIDPKCLTVSLIHHPQRPTCDWGKAAGRTFSTGHCFGGRRGRLSTQRPSRCSARERLERKSGAERLRGIREARITQRTETRRWQHSAPRVLPRTACEPGKGAVASQRSLGRAREGWDGRDLGWWGAEPAPELSSRRLMGIVVLETSQAPPKGSGNYTSRGGNGSSRPRVVGTSHCPQPGPDLRSVRGAGRQGVLFLHSALRQRQPRLTSPHCRELPARLPAPAIPGPLKEFGPGGSKVTAAASSRSQGRAPLQPSKLRPRFLPPWARLRNPTCVASWVAGRWASSRGMQAWCRGRTWASCGRWCARWPPAAGNGAKGRGATGG